MKASAPRRASAFFLASLAFPSAYAATRGQEPAPSTAATKPASIYDANADARAEIAAALATAKKDDKRVLVVYGADWCGWCRKLHDLFKTDPEIRRLLLYEYEQVRVDIGKFDHNMELAEGYGADLHSGGVPYLTVLDADGKVLTNQNTGDLEAGPRHDPAKVKAFLEKWPAVPREAERVLAEALARAEAAGKMVFLHLGAPW